MWVIRQERLGNPSVLHLVEIPVPRPGEAEVLVRVHAAGVNPVDWKTRQHGGFLGQPPFVLGWDVSGVVTALGHGSSGFEEGDAVVGLLRFPEEAGGYGEYVVAPVDQLAIKPPTMSFETAAALPLAGLTAWQALVDVAALQPGHRVLIHAAAGGVGHLAAQLAAALGAHVLGTSQPTKHGFLRSLGVHDAIDYTASGWQRRVRELDVILDPFGGTFSHDALGMLRPGGVLVSLRTSVDPELAIAAERRGVRFEAIVVHPDSRALDTLLDLVERGVVRVCVSRQFPFHQAAEAHRYGEDGRTTGKIVLGMT